jgi:hypothetical protein
MSSEQRLDRLERILLLVVKAGARERKAARGSFKETDEKINALIDAQMRHEEAYAQFKNRTDEAQLRTEEAQARTDEAMAHLARAQADTAEALRAFITNTDEKLNAFITNTDEKLSAFIVNTDEKLNAFIGAVERLVNERREEKP